MAYRTVKTAQGKRIMKVKFDHGDKWQVVREFKDTKGRKYCQMRDGSIRRM